MNRITAVFKAAFSMAAFSLLLSGAILLVSPASVAAQRCAICVYDGGFDCEGSPVGFARCYLGPNTCRLAIPCEELSHLQFGEDGTATRMASDVPDPGKKQPGDRTCDGVLLRVREAEEVTAGLAGLPPGATRPRGNATNPQHNLVI